MLELLPLNQPQLAVHPITLWVHPDLSTRTPILVHLVCVRFTIQHLLLDPDVLLRSKGLTTIAIVHVLVLDPDCRLRGAVVRRSVRVGLSLHRSVLVGGSEGPRLPREGITHGLRDGTIRFFFVLGLIGLVEFKQVLQKGIKSWLGPS